MWRDDGRSLYDLFHSEWTLLALGSAPPSAEGFERVAARLRLDLHIVHLPSRELLDLYEAPLALIRRGQIVAWRGADPSAAEAVLAQASGW